MYLAVEKKGLWGFYPVGTRCIWDVGIRSDLGRRQDIMTEMFMYAEKG